MRRRYTLLRARQTLECITPVARKAASGDRASTVRNARANCHAFPKGATAYPRRLASSSAGPGGAMMAAIEPVVQSRSRGKRHAFRAVKVAAVQSVDQRDLHLQKRRANQPFAPGGCPVVNSSTRGLRTRRPRLPERCSALPTPRAAEVAPDTPLPASVPLWIRRRLRSPGP